MITALLISAVLAVTRGDAAAGQEQPPEGVAVYRAETEDHAIAFSAQWRDLKLFYGPYRSDIWKSHRGGLFKIENENGILVEKSMSMSLPVDIENTKEWQVDRWSCKSTKFFHDRWLIQCSGGAVYNSYIYRQGIGITGFSFACGGIRPCWYAIETEKGIFSEL